MSKRHQPYQSIAHYKVSFTIPDDKETEAIIKTKSLGVAFATSPQDALNQTNTENEYTINPMFLTLYDICEVTFGMLMLIIRNLPIQMNPPSS